MILNTEIYTAENAQHTGWNSNSMSDIKVTHTWWYLSFLISVFLVIRLYHGVGLYFADDFAYVEAALNANEYGWLTYLKSLNSIYANRVSIVIPVAFFMKAFGSSEVVLHFIAMTVSLGGIVCAFFLGKVLCNRAVGIIAAIAAAFIPQEIRLATAILPDTFIPFYSGMSFLCLVKGLISPKKARQEFYLYVLSGFFLFCAFEARATCGILIIPFALGAFWLKRFNIIAITLPIASFFMFVGLLWLLIFILNGDFLTQYRLFVTAATTKRYYGTGVFLDHTKKMMPLLKVVLNPGEIAHEGFLASRADIHKYLMNYELGLFYYLLLPAFFYCAVKSWKDVWPRLPLAVFGLLYLFLEFGSTNLLEYKPIWKLTRFLTFLTIPGSVLIGIFVVELWHIEFKKKWRSLIKVVLIFTGIAYIGTTFFALNELNKSANAVQAYREVFEKIKSVRPCRKIYIVHSRWKLRGAVFTRLRPGMPCEFIRLQHVSVKDIKQAIVILDLSFFTKYKETRSIKLKWKRFDPALKEVPKTLPKGWELISTHHRPMKRGRFADIYVLWAP
jgi:hypothetical protein